MEGDIIVKDTAAGNQLENTLLNTIQQNTKKIDQLTVDLEKSEARQTSLSHLVQQIDFRTIPGGYSQLENQVWKWNNTFKLVGAVVMLVRKQCDNAVDFFDKNFEEYEEGFAANGEL